MTPVVNAARKPLINICVDRVCKLMQERVSVTDIAKRFGVSRTVIYRVIKEKNNV